MQRLLFEALQRGDQWAVDIAPCGRTAIHEADQGCFNALKVNQLGADICQLQLRLLPSFVAVGAIFQGQQLCNLIKIKAQSLRRLDEPHPPQISLSISAHATWRSFGLLHQALALVKADGFNTDLRLDSERADGQVFERCVHDA